ncbi:MAG: DUF4168 domain-containing protein [Geminicoccaceae bacterium]
MQLVRSSLVLSGVLAALMVLAVPTALTQEQPAAPPAELSQGQLEAFADAAVEVQRLQTELDTDLQGAASPEEAARLQQEAQDEASRAVEARGLTTGEYLAIVQAAERDPALYAMITDMMQQRAQ